MDARELLLDGFGRLRPLVAGALGDLTREQLEHQLDRETNTIAWLIWHTGRVVDSQIADVAGTEQVWKAAGWASRFSMAFDVRATGYAQSAAEAALVLGDRELLKGYVGAALERAVGFVEQVTPLELDRVVDTRWDPPVTLGVRLMSILDDCLQHCGQAAYLRGILERAAAAR